MTRTPHTLPAERDVFVGREEESAELERHLSQGARLVTLVGAGGMGKTRLAIHHGWRSLHAWPGGVWFCNLTEAHSLDGLASAMADSLSVPLGRSDPVEQIGHAIAGRGRTLVILDNFEQVVDQAAETVGRWVVTATEAVFLVTSREKLALGDLESVLPIEPLSIDAGVDLLVARARQLLPRLQISGSEAEAVREIVRLVDGMPLSLELAGARMRQMSAGQILAHMRHRFSLLTGGASSRHETLVATIEGSWELLRPWERAAWTQCSVFEGGFTLEAAEGVLDLGAYLEEPRVMDVLPSLVDKSLLRTWVPPAGVGEGIAEARFGMFVSLQEFARMKLRENPTLPGSVDHTSEVERRHGEWFARYGTSEAIQKLQERSGHVERLRRGREIDNLVAACRRAIARGDAPTGAATYLASWSIVNLRGPFRVAIDLGREVLLRLPVAGPARAEVARVLGTALWYSGSVEESRASLETALTLSRAVGDRQEEGLILASLWGHLSSQGRMEEACVSLEVALEIAQAVGDRHSECNVLSSLAMVFRGLGRMEQARASAVRALEISRVTGNRYSEGFILCNLGLLLQDVGRNGEARAHYHDALAIFREVGYRRFEGNAHTNLGGLNLDQGRMEEARTHLEAGLAIHRETGDRPSEGIVLSNLGLVSQDQELEDQAVECFDRALAIHREVGNQRLEGVVLAALGSFHRDRGEMELARDRYEKALARHRAVDNRRSEATTLAELARCLFKQRLIDEAWETLATAEAMLRELDASQGLSHALCTRAELEHERGHAPAAHASLREAEGIAARIGSGPESELGRRIARLRHELVLRAGRGARKPV
jgi:tetratricopeptide (TPR) repeat protein